MSVNLSILQDKTDINVSVEESDQGVNLNVEQVEETTNVVVQRGPTGAQGIQGESYQETFESVNSNIQSYDFTINRTNGAITSVVYTKDSETITKTLNRTEGVVTSIVLSGDTPSGIDLIKTLIRTSGNITSVDYS